MNIKRFISIFLVFVLSLGMSSVAIAEGNSEIPEGYTPVYTAEDLNNIRNNLSGKYILMNDIDLSVYENWEPIGTQETPFMGEINGNGNAVRNMTVDVETSVDNTFVGLFGFASNASFNKLNVLDCDIKIVYNNDKSNARIYVGSVVGCASGSSKINGLLVSGNINVITSESTANVGGIGGVLKNEVSSCKNLADITVISEEDYSSSINAGGIAGDIFGVASECCNYGTIETVTYSDVMDIVYTGGIVGDIRESSIVNSYNAGNVKSDHIYDISLGGIAGHGGNIKNSYNIGQTTINNSTEKTCGISGYTEFWLYDSFGTGLPPQKLSELENCYYLNIVAEPTEYFGDEIMTNVISISNEEFKDQDTFVGFDFDDVWQMDEELGRPVLVNEPEIKEPNPPVDEPTDPQPPVDEPTEPNPPVEEPDTPTPEYCIILRIINWMLNSIKSTFQFVLNALRVL